MEIGVRTYDMDSHVARSLLTFDVNIIGSQSNHLDSDPLDFSSLRSKLRDTVIDGVSGTEVPITAFVSGIHKEWWTDVLYSADVVKAGAPSFEGHPVVWNHSFDSRDVIGRILESKGVDIDDENSKIIMRLFIIDEEARQKLKDGLLQEVSVAMFVDEDFDLVKDEDSGRMFPDNFRVVELVGEHLGIVQRGAVSPGDGAGLGIGADLGDFEDVPSLMSVPEAAYADLGMKEFAAHFRVKSAGIPAPNDMRLDAEAPPPVVEDDSIPTSKSNRSTAKADDNMTGENPPTDPSSGAELEAKLKALQARLGEAEEREAAMKASSDAMEAELATRRQEEKDRLIAAIVAKNSHEAAEYADMDITVLKAILGAIPDAPEPTPAEGAQDKRKEADDASYIKGTKFEKPSLLFTGTMSPGGSPNFQGASAAIDELGFGDSMILSDEAIAIAMNADAGVIKGMESAFLNDPKIAARVAAMRS